jgi:integrase
MKRDLPAFVQSRKGGKYLYFIRRNWPAIRIHSQPGTPEFAAEYARILNGQTPPPPGRGFQSLIASYKRSRRFTKLAPRTRQDYDKVLAFIEEKLGALPADKMRRKDVVRLRDTNAATVRFANYCVQVLRVLFEHARDEGWREDNPAKGVPLLTSEGKLRQPWPQEAIEDFRAAAPVGTRARLVFDLLHGTGQRIGDVLRMRWDDIEDGGLWVRQGKTGARLWVPLTPTLAATLAATPRAGMTILVGANRRPLSYRAAHDAVMKIRKQIDAETHDLHALRYSAASELAAAGCTDEQIESITGHATVAMIRRYAGPARQKARATEAQRTRK